MSEIRTIPEGIHALLSPSKASMWMTCHGALAYGRNQKDEPSEYAAEGTAYHDVSSRVLSKGGDCSDHIGAKYKIGQFGFTVDADNAEYAQVYVDAIRRIPGKLFVEVDLKYHELLDVPEKLPDGRPIAGGTGDAVVLDFDNKIIHSDDLKFGRGDVVYAKWNPQLLLYGVAAIKQFDYLGIDETWHLKTAIHQPRVNHYDEYRYTVAEALAWVENEAAIPARRALQYYQQCMDPGDAFLQQMLTPGDKACRWCPMRGKCVAQDSKIAKSFPIQQIGKIAERRGELSNEALAEAYLRSEELEHYIKAIRSEALSRALSGITLSGLKLVDGRRGDRKTDPKLTVEWSVAALKEAGVEALKPGCMAIEEMLFEALENAAYEPKEVLSVAKLEKKLKKSFPVIWSELQAHVTQSEPGKSLARLEDPRAPVPVTTPEFPLASPAAAGLV